MLIFWLFFGRKKKPAAVLLALEIIVSYVLTKLLCLLNLIVFTDHFNF